MEGKGEGEEGEEREGVKGRRNRIIAPEKILALPLQIIEEIARTSATVHTEI